MPSRPSTLSEQGPASDRRREGRLDPLTAGMSAPLDAPLYAAGPSGWAYRETWLTAVTFETDEAPFLAMLPSPLRPAHPRPRVTVTALECRHSSFGDYNEMKLDLAAELHGQPVRYCAHIVVGAVDGSLAPDAALAVGRELLGVPKKIGHIVMRRDAGQVVATLQRPIGVPIITIGVGMQEATTPEAAGLTSGVPGANLRVIPSVAGGRPAIAELVRFATAIRPDPAQTWTGPAWVAPGVESAHDPWCRLPVRQVLHGVTFQADLDIPPAGEVLLDYLEGR